MRYHRALQFIQWLALAVLSQLSGAAIAGETTFDVPRIGFTLKGVLDTPEGPGPFPLVLILPGSGAVNADGNTPGALDANHGLHNSSSRQLADGLNAAGYAVARINKRGLSPSTGEGTGATLQEFADDYLGVLAVLRSNSLIDPARIVIAGRSEGGPIEMLMAPQAKAAGFIFIESPGQSMTRVTTDQVLTIARAKALPADRLSEIEEFQNGFYDAVAKASDGQPMEYRGKAFPSAVVRHLKSSYALDVPALARQVKEPSLVIQGAQDFNVAPENGKLLAAALPHSTLVMIDDMSHVLTVTKTRDPMQLDVPAGTPLHPKVIPVIVDWLHKTVPISR